MRKISSDSMELESAGGTFSLIAIKLRIDGQRALNFFKRLCLYAQVTAKRVIIDEKRMQPLLAHINVVQNYFHQNHGEK